VKSFGSRELINCLKILGFSQKPQVGSRHLKFSTDRAHKIGERSFIIVLQNKKLFDPVTQGKYVKQIMKWGFTEEEIVHALLGKI